MIIFKRSAELVAYLHDLRLNKLSVGFVPTMGALHAGHSSLVIKSVETCDKTLASIFINPTQFNNPKDLEKYPITIEKDVYLLEKAGCDVLFLPDVTDVYPDGIKQKKKYDLGNLETILEGKYRPGHFQGVCLVVESLLRIVNPTHLFIGQKDYQQCMVITKLVELMQLSLSIIICPTLRENDGLAMSSRNLRLNNEQRKRAPRIHEVLVYIKENFLSTDINNLKSGSVRMLEENGFKVDYVEIANAKDMGAINDINVQPSVALIAASLDDIRLIDNFVLE